VFSHGVLGFLIYGKNNSMINSFCERPIKGKLNTKDGIAFPKLI
jgi:hypothetical protein